MDPAFALIVEDEHGKLIGKHTLVLGSLAIGRTHENDIVLPSGAVSRQHARLDVRNDGVWIQDLGSANGVLVDDALIDGPTAIRDTHQIRIGEFRLYVEQQHRRRAARQDHLSTAIVHPEQAHAKLVVTDGPGAGREHFFFESTVRIGRTDENDVSLADVSVSRHHARLRRQPDGTYGVTDLNSSNGTFINGRAVQSGRARLGDRLQFGNVDCLLVDAHGRGHRGSGFPSWALIAAGLALAAGLGVVVTLLLGD